MDKPISEPIKSGSLFIVKIESLLKSIFNFWFIDGLKVILNLQINKMYRETKNIKSKSISCLAKMKHK